MIDSLRVLQRAMSAAHGHGTMEDAARAVIAEVCAATGWPGGWLRRAGQGEGVPIVVGGEIVAVLEFDGTPDDELREALAVVGHQLAAVEERARAEARYQALTDSAPDAIVTAGPDGTILSFNAGAERTFGWSATEVVGRPVGELVPSRCREQWEAALTELASGGRRFELTGIRSDGREFPVEVSLSSWAGPTGRHATAIVRDVSERRQAEQDRKAFERQLAQRTLYDTLTELPNRTLFLDRIAHALARARRRESLIAVVAVNVDHFKAVNDSYGHHVGDELLVAAARRLQQVVRPDDTLARVGGDEFAILCEDVGSHAAAFEIAERVTHGLANLFVIEGHAVAVSASSGVAVTGDVTVEPDQLLRDAGAAVELARQRGRGRAALYDGSLRADEAERLAVEHDLRGAIRDGQLRLYYQPIVDLLSGAVDGVEALVRWEHPSRGLLPPVDFIGLAEDSGLIVPLGSWVLEEACRQGAEWQRDLGLATPLRVSVNVSAHQFQRPEWTDEVARVLLTSGLDPGRLVLEITESVLMEDTETTSRRLSDLRALGVRIAIDDFGTGYSSLGYLRHFPVDILKVDKSFIDGVADGPHESALARAVIRLAASLGLHAVAEGVSNRKQLAMLRRLRCRYAQGYYFARPQPAEGVNDLLNARVLAS